jgi:hypothetical protein
MKRSNSITLSSYHTRGLVYFPGWSVLLLWLMMGCSSSSDGTGPDTDNDCPNPIGMRLTLGAQDYCGLNLSDLRNFRVYADTEARTWTSEREVADQLKYTSGEFNTFDGNACRTTVISQFERDFRPDGSTTVGVTVSYDIEMSSEAVFGLAQVRVRCNPAGACGNGFVGGECLFTANVDGTVYCTGDDCEPLGATSGTGGSAGQGGAAGTGGSAGQGGAAGTGGSAGQGGAAGTGGSAGQGGAAGTGEQVLVVKQALSPSAVMGRSRRERRAMMETPAPNRATTVN